MLWINFVCWRWTVSTKLLSSSDTPNHMKVCWTHLIICCWNFPTPAARRFFVCRSIVCYKWLQGKRCTWTSPCNADYSGTYWFNFTEVLRIKLYNFSGGCRGFLSDALIHTLMGDAQERTLISEWVRCVIFFLLAKRDSRSFWRNHLPPWCGIREAILVCSVVSWKSENGNVPTTAKHPSPWTHDSLILWITVEEGCNLSK